MIAAHIDLFDIDFIRVFEVETAFYAKLESRLIFGSALWTFHRKSLLRSGRKGRYCENTGRYTSFISSSKNGGTFSMCRLIGQAVTELVPSGSVKAAVHSEA